MASQSSFVAPGGHEIQMTTTLCPGRESAAINHSEFTKRQDDTCVPDDEDVDECRNSQECLRAHDAPGPAPPTFISDCTTLTSALDVFTGEFTIAAGQTITFTFCACTTSLTSGGGQISGICGSSWSDIAFTVQDRCSEDHLGGDYLWFWSLQPQYSPHFCLTVRCGRPISMGLMTQFDYYGFHAPLLLLEFVVMPRPCSG
ncbi:hypothetical protein DFH09DRAFT_1278509, partial [Mycena vulgaris]